MRAVEMVDNSAVVGCTAGGDVDWVVEATGELTGLTRVAAPAPMRQGEYEHAVHSVLQRCRG